MSIEDLDKRLSGFNFLNLRVDGHNHYELTNIFHEFFQNKYNKPLVLTADTIKGKGVSFMENITMWHHRKLKDEEYNLAIQELQDEMKSI